MHASTPQYYRELIVWQKAMDLFVACYRLARLFPAEERFGMSSQLRRAALSIPLNIAEGNGRRTRGEYLASLSVAHGSLMEVQTLCDAVDRLGLLPTSELDSPRALSAHVGRLLNGLMRALEKTGSSTNERMPRSRSPVPGPGSPAGPDLHHPSPAPGAPSRSGPRDPARSR